MAVGQILEKKIVQKQDYDTSETFNKIMTKQIYLQIYTFKSTASIE